jgi:outer membrane protein
VRKSLIMAPVLALGITALVFGQTAATPPTKVGIIHIQNAIAQTKDGQKAAAEIEAKYGPRRKEVEQSNNELQQMETQYRNTANTMSDDARQKLMRDIDQRRKQLQRTMDDSNAELQQDQDRLLQQLGQKMMSIIDRYAADHGFALILDISSPQSPVLFASNTIDITRDIVELYDKQSAAAPATAAPAAGSNAATPSAAPRPTTPAAPRSTAAPKK